jgi:hypothetical protein
VIDIRVIGQVRVHELQSDQSAEAPNATAPREVEHRHAARTDRCDDFIVFDAIARGEHGTATLHGKNGPLQAPADEKWGVSGRATVVPPPALLRAARAESASAERGNGMVA